MLEQACVGGGFFIGPAQRHLILLIQVLETCDRGIGIIKYTLKQQLLLYWQIVIQLLATVTTFFVFLVFLSDSMQL